MEANVKDVKDTEHLDEVPWAQLTPKQKQQRQANSPAGIRARKKHLKKRVQYPISLNSELKKDQDILDVLSSDEFSLMAWFRFVFEEYYIICSIRVLVIIWITICNNFVNFYCYICHYGNSKFLAHCKRT